MMSHRHIGPLLAACLAACHVIPADAQEQDNTIRINQIQVIGTHNSYHAGIAPNEAILWQKNNPDLYREVDYRHKSLTEQLSAGVRQLELDVFADQAGGLYAHPAGPQLVAQAGLPADPDFDPEHIMDKPGFKVMHVQDVDYRSVCQPFTNCLAEIRLWSKAHPRHLPIFILVETKQKPLHLAFPTIQPEPFTPDVFDALDKEIASVFSRREIITPDDVRHGRASLADAVRHNGWPTLAQARGRVIFLMDQPSVGPMYLAGHPALEGRLIFTNATPGAADAAFTEQNSGSVETIDALVRRGYLVRTRTDENTIDARNNDTTRRDIAMASAAQILSTDYPASEPAATGFTVAFPGDLVARCNMVQKPKHCTDALLEPR